MTKTGRLRVAALMPSLNEEASVDSTFASLFAGTRQPDEVIVADGGSTDRTLERVRAWADKGHPISIVENPGVFPGAGRNAAAKVATSDIFVCVDFGNSFDAEYIEKMAAPFESDAAIGIVAGTFVPKIASPLERIIAIIDYHNGYAALTMTPEQRRKLAPKDDQHVPGGSVAWRRELWMQAGGQPDWLRAAEDLLFGHKLLTFKPRFALQLEAHTYHHMRSSIPAFFHMRKTYARGRCRAGLMKASLLKQRLFFSLLMALAVGSLFFSFLLPAATVLGAVWIWKNVIKPLRQAEEQFPSAPDVGRGIAVAAAREAGALFGLALGTIDWCTDPALREARKAYLPFAAEASRAP